MRWVIFTLGRRNLKIFGGCEVSSDEFYLKSSERDQWFLVIDILGEMSPLGQTNLNF